MIEWTIDFCIILFPITTYLFTSLLFNMWFFLKAFKFFKNIPLSFKVYFKIYTNSCKKIYIDFINNNNISFSLFIIIKIRTTKMKSQLQ